MNVFRSYLIQFYKSADRLVVVNPSFIDALVEYGIDRERIYYIPNYVSKEKFYRKSDEACAAIRKKYGVDKDAFVVLGAGQVQTRKGVLDFVEVAKEFPDVTFVWFGHLNKLAQTKVIKKAIKNRPNNVKMPGYISGDIIKGALTYANALLFPSYEETEGIVVLEAMASKTPVIVRNIPVYDQFQDGVNVLKANNNEEFIKHVKTTLNNDLKEIVDNAYKNVLKKDLKHIGAQIKKVY